jgi:hypothetical protein
MAYMAVTGEIGLPPLLQKVPAAQVAAQLQDNKKRNSSGTQQKVE